MVQSKKKPRIEKQPSCFEFRSSNEMLGFPLKTTRQMEFLLKVFNDQEHFKCVYGALVKVFLEEARKENPKARKCASEENELSLVFDALHQFYRKPFILSHDCAEAAFMQAVPLHQGGPKLCVNARFAHSGSNAQRSMFLGFFKILREGCHFLTPVLFVFLGLSPETAVPAKLGSAISGQPDFGFELEQQLFGGKLLQAIGIENFDAFKFPLLLVDDCSKLSYFLADAYIERINGLIASWLSRDVMPDMNLVCPVEADLLESETWLSAAKGGIIEGVRVPVLKMSLQSAVALNANLRNALWITVEEYDISADDLIYEVSGSSVASKDICTVTSEELIELRELLKYENIPLMHSRDALYESRAEYAKNKK